MAPVNRLEGDRDVPSFDYSGKHVTFTGRYTGSYDCINNGRFYEQPFLEHVRSLGIGGTYLDIGTNIGNHAVYFALFCPSRRVIGFEPVEPWRIRAESNIAANGCEGKVEIVPRGLLDAPRELVFKPYSTAYTLDCTTLDLALPDLNDVGVIKMDIEGSEPDALRGGREFFRRNRPVIFAECLGDTSELLAAASAIGYAQAGMFLEGASPMMELRPVG